MFSIKGLLFDQLYDWHYKFQDDNKIDKLQATGSRYHPQETPDTHHLKWSQTFKRQKIVALPYVIN